MGRVIEIANSQARLSLFRGFLVVKIGEEQSRIPLDNIDSLIINPTGLSITSNLINQLLDHRVLIILLGNNYSPKAIIQPVNSHYLQKNRLELQIKASKPLKKQLWQNIVRQKIANQGKILAKNKIDEPAKQLLELAKKVDSGDKNNSEAFGARIYWQNIFIKSLDGEKFIRSAEDVSPLNSMLNYGYAILRSAMARAVFLTGLNPSLGIFHCNQQNAFCLVDDLIEPFRPVVDDVVLAIYQENQQIKELDAKIKSRLVAILEIAINLPEGSFSLALTMQKFAQSFALSLENSAVELIEIDIANNF